MAPKFSTDIHNALHGKSHYPPQLHRVCKNRHKAGPPRLSLCPDLIEIKRTLRGNPEYARTDHRKFQYETRYNDFPFIFNDWNRLDRQEAMRTFLVECCPVLTEKFLIYGTIGRGSFGIIFAARERKPPSGRKAKHFALKVERHAPFHLDNKTDVTTNCPYKEFADKASNAVNRWIPKEAIVLGLLTGSDKFPLIDSVYLHEHFQVMAMSADSLDDDPLRDQVDETLEYPTEHKFPGYPGTNLMQRRRKGTKLNEAEACKVASQLLEALMYLMDMNIVHGDLSHRNYLVDEDLNTQLIDLGLVTFAPKEDDFKEQYWAFLEPQEYQMSPELAIEMSKDYWREKEEKHPGRQLDVLLPHDCRVSMIWKFGVLIYDLLHGYSPWEDADDLEVVPLRTHPLTIGTAELDKPLSEEDSNPKPEDKIPTRADVLVRRHRIINNELPIDEHLSQDCVDVLRAMFEKDPNDRPSLQDLCTFPWFQGWWMDQGPFQRPGRTGTSLYPGMSPAAGH